MERKSDQGVSFSCTPPWVISPILLPVLLRQSARPLSEESFAFPAAPGFGTGCAVPVTVRWPFRILAMLFCAAALAGLGGMAIALLLESRLGATDRVLATLRLLVMLPGILWLLRLFGHAARYANFRDYQNPYWPFASFGVWFAYLVLAAFVWHAYRL